MHNVYTEEYRNLKCAASRIENQETKSEWTHLITSQIKKENTIKKSFNHKKKEEREYCQFSTSTAHLSYFVR